MHRGRIIINPTQAGRGGGGIVHIVPLQVFSLLCKTVSRRLVELSDF